MRVPAILYRPRNLKGKAPAVIVVSGHGGDKYSWYAFYTGVLYARGGALVLTYDPTGEGERNPERRSGTRAHDKLERIEKLGRRQAGQMITDVMQAISYLVQRPEVDPERIAAMGYSMGSFVLAITGAVDVRMKACVLVGGAFSNPTMSLKSGWSEKGGQVVRGNPFCDDGGVSGGEGG